MAKSMQQEIREAVATAFADTGKRFRYMDVVQFASLRAELLAKKNLCHLVNDSLRAWDRRGLIINRKYRIRRVGRDARGGNFYEIYEVKPLTN